MTETWKPLKDIAECGNNYEISNTGKVRNIKRGVLMTISTPSSRKYYPKVTLHYKGKGKMYLLHRLLALSFIPNPDNKPNINHIDGNKHNYDLSNLEWVTQAENLKHAKDTGLNRNHSTRVYHSEPESPEQYIPVNQNNRKLTETDVRKIRELYRTGDFSHSDLGAMFNIGKRNITQILNYKTWKHVV